MINGKLQEFTESFYSDLLEGEADINDILMAAVEEKIGQIESRSDNIKSNIESASHPEELIVPYDAALMIELTTFLYVTRGLVDQRPDEETLRSYITIWKQRMEEYNNFITTIRTVTLKNFSADWNVDKSFTSNCHPYCVDEDVTGRCDDFACSGGWDCWITSTYLEPTHNIHEEGGCHIDGHASCYYSTNCNELYEEFKSSESHAKSNVKEMLDSMQEIIFSVTKILGRYLLT